MKTSLLTVLFLAITMSTVPHTTDAPELLSGLKKYCATLEAEFDQIPAERKEELNGIAEYLQGKVKEGSPAQFTVICTHNSRRSHMGQLWIQVAAAYYGIPQVTTFSGGTEATAFNPRAVASLKRAGFDIQSDNKEDNPNYTVTYSKDAESLLAFSKKYDNPQNPQSGFCALMVCSQADEACPIVRGAEKRVSIPYQDPKAFDNTDQESAKYDERCRQIAREMFYFASQVKK